jgi:hypothetical protein
VPWLFVDPVIEAPFKVNPQTKIASAGSCFAQHIARYLEGQGYNYFMTEPCPPGGQFFSAQYGNIYTTRHLRQLMERITGAFQPGARTSVWRRKEDGLFVDAFRPTISPPRETVDEVARDRREHLEQVRRLFQEMEVFIFTMGLTECWCGRQDGAVFPVAPGVVNSLEDPGAFEFHNLKAEEVRDDFSTFLTELRKINPSVTVLLTVSPVPLAATYENKHVLVANTYSKSVLRVAAEELCQKWDDCFYFPSYEIFTGQHTQARLYESDLREASAHGVSLAMTFFKRHYMVDDGRKLVRYALATETSEEVVCDEDLIA